MGRTVNPGNEGFTEIRATRYVDKTGLITEFDSTVDTNKGLVLSARPRRFGKTFSAHMPVAFYSCGCGSRQLFEELEVSRHEGWDVHLNAYNVVQLDMAGGRRGGKGGGTGLCWGGRGAKRQPTIMAVAGRASGHKTHPGRAPRDRARCRRAHRVGPCRAHRGNLGRGERHGP